MLVDERLLTHNVIDLASLFLIMKDLQDIPLLLFSVEILSTIVGRRKEGVVAL